MTLILCVMIGCATFSPRLGEMHRGEGSISGSSPAQAPAVVLLGDVGVPRGHDARLVDSIRRRVGNAIGVPLLMLGDLFYRDGLLGFCPESDPKRSRRGCDAPTPPQVQFDAVFARYAQTLPGNPIIGLAGNHDRAGDPESTRNACQLLPQGGPGWVYIAQDCGLDLVKPIERLELPGLTVFLLDSERMIADRTFRRASAEALHAELATHTQNRRDQWRVIAAHHPLESYGRHNGGAFLTALHKDMYPLLGTLLAPVYWAVDALSSGSATDQDLYMWRYRAYRRALYRVFEDHPVDLFVSGHDHSLQLIEIEHPGVKAQVISGATAQNTPVKRVGLDLLFANRLARVVGLGGVLPAPKHHLRFALGDGMEEAYAGYGYATLTATSASLFVEFYDLNSDSPLSVTEVSH